MGISSCIQGLLASICQVCADYSVPTLPDSHGPQGCRLSLAVLFYALIKGPWKLLGGLSQHFEK